MPNLGMPRFIPGDPRQVIFGLKILEANVPNESAECLNGIDLIALCADETKTQVLVGIFGKAFLLIRRVIVAGVLKRVETHIAQRYCPSRERFGLHAQWLRRFSARIGASHAADRGKQSLQMPTPH